MNPDRAFWPAVALLLPAMLAVEVVTALGETQTWDEGIHISAGYAYWKYGDYGWNSEHPPLVKMVSALPLLPLKPKLPVEMRPWELRDAVVVGSDFLYRNRVPADTLLFRARSMTIVLTVLGGLLLALWIRRHFGAAAALVALALYACDPNLLAHGRYVTTDVPMAVFFFLACAAWCEYLMSGRKRDLAAAALVFAVAMVVKFSAVLLIPVYGLLYAVRWWQAPRAFRLRRLLAAGAALAGACVLVTGLVYWKETVRMARGQLPPTAAPTGQEPAGQRMLMQAAHTLGLPRHAYLKGLEAVIEHSAGGHSSYLFGRHSETGWWYYFPAVFAVKSTLAALAATLLVAAAVLWRTGRACGRGWRAATADVREIPFPWVALLAPPVLYFGASMTSSLNLGVRHILPVYPFLYGAAAALLARAPWRPALGYAALALAALQAGEAASIHPDYLAFFNAACGGPGNGPKYLVDSNIDWGQDLKKLARWLNAHGTRRVWINYFGAADMTYYGIEAANPPAGDDSTGWDAIDGFAAASVTPLEGVYVPWVDLAPLRRLPVAAKVGYSIYVYDLRKARK